MKFKHLLDMNMVPEWRNQYLDYEALDAALNRAIEDKSLKSRQKGLNMYFELIKSNQKFADFFQSECQQQLDKINNFHKEKLSEMRGKSKNLQDQLDQVLSSAVYRDLKPELSQWGGAGGLPSGNNKNSTYLNSTGVHENLNEDDTVSYSTVSSISDLFRSLRQRLHSRPLSPSGSGADSPVSIQIGSPAVGRAISGRPHSPSNVQRWARRAGSIAPALGEASAAGLRAGRQKLVNVARKLSDGFAAGLGAGEQRKGSTSRLMDELNRLNAARAEELSTGSAGPVRQPHNFRVGQSTTQTDELASHHQHHHPSSRLGAAQHLAGATPQSKKTIIASYRKKISHLKFAFRELYFSLVLFEQYTQLNHTGFEQILRKHDRMFASTLGRKFYQEHVQTADFYLELQSIDQLLETLEHIYTLHFAHGNRRKAIEKLQVPPNVYKQSSPMLDFRVGCELGAFAILFVLVLVRGFLTETDYDWRTVFRLYRSPLLVIIFLFQWGISISIWKHYKINHVLIFELNPRNNLSFHHFLEFGSLLGIIWCISVLLFFHSDSYSIPPAVYPFVVVLLMIIFLFNPTATCHHRARFWLLRKLGCIVSAPLCPVRLADFWIADQMVSIVPLFLDLEYLSCFYTAGDALELAHLNYEYASRCVTRKPQDLVVRTIVAALPAWFRCAQCLRRWRDENWLGLHLANAGKYGSMVLVVVLSSISQYQNPNGFELDTMRCIWLGAALITSALTAYWDIIYDFGLFSTYDNNNDETTGSGSTNSSTTTTPDRAHTMKSDSPVADSANEDLCSASSSASGVSEASASHPSTSFTFCSGKQTPTRNRQAQSESNDDTPAKFFLEAAQKRRKQRQRKYPFLRKELVYPVWVYYFAIVEDCILRFGWIITISLTEFSRIEAGIVVSLLAPMEMFRRFVWNCIRLENEQLNNCGLFRAVRDIPIEVVAPIDESHLDKVIMMMDSRDGPSMRNRLMKRRTLRPDRVSFLVLQQPDDPSRAVTKRTDIRL